MSETTTNREHPILFSGEMVRAIRGGRKTQTRRVVTWRNSTVLAYPAKSYWPGLNFDMAQRRGTSSLMDFLTNGNAPPDVHLSVPWRHKNDSRIPWEDCGRYRVRPIWEPGDRLWVRETWRETEDPMSIPVIQYRAGGAQVIGRNGDDVDFLCGEICGDFEREDEPWKPSIFMPRWACRIVLEITDVRVERVQDISERDACAEGFGYPLTRDCKKPKFRELWDKLNGPRGYGWEVNPWVWAISFRRT